MWASALRDLELHRAHVARGKKTKGGAERSDGLDDQGFEKATLSRIGMPLDIVIAHRPPTSSTSSAEVAAAYYSYMLSEVLALTLLRVTRNRRHFRLRHFQEAARSGLCCRRRHAIHGTLLAFRGRLPSAEGLLKTPRPPRQYHTAEADRFWICIPRDTARECFGAPHHAAVEAGRMVRAIGGNAMTAMVAMAPPSLSSIRT